MKVLIVSPCDLPVPAVKGGAVATLIESLIKENTVKKQLSVDVISIYDEDAKKKSEKYFNTKFIWIKVPKAIKILDKIIDSLLVCAKISHKPKEYCRKLYVIKQISSYQEKSTPYDAVIIQNSGYLLKAFKKTDNNNLYYYLHNDIPRNADKDILNKCKFILISEYLKIGVKNYIPDISSDRMVVLKNGININHFTQKCQPEEVLEFKREFGISREKKIILFVGRINESKGLKELLKAMELNNREDIQLVIIGSTNFGMKEKSAYEKEIENYCNKLGQRVIMTGFVHNSEIWKCYALSDVVVLPSIWQEPAGLTMIEACASGTPLITTKSGGIPEYISDEYSIILDINDELPTKISESINQILENEEYWMHNAMCAQQRVINKFSENVYYKNFVNVLCDGKSMM